MADTSNNGENYGLFWNSENGDRVYSADSLEKWLKRFFTSGVFHGDCQVLAVSGFVVSVTPGYANTNGKVRMFPTATEVVLDPPHSTYPRIDTIVIERNNTDRAITIKKVTGAYSGVTPAPTPPVRNYDYYQLVLAQIYVSAGASEITQANITDTRPNADICGYVVSPVDTFDFSQYAAQFDAYLSEFEETSAADFTEWSNDQKALFITWMANEQSSFDTWLDDIKESLHNLPPDTAEYLQLEIDELQAGQVKSFNGRSGSVLPMAGDYTDSMIPLASVMHIGGETQETTKEALEAIVEELGEFTPSVTQANNSVVFDNLNPDYGYELCFDDEGATGALTVPTWTGVTKATGTNSTASNPLIKLTYTISGGTNGTSKFALRISK